MTATATRSRTGRRRSGAGAATLATLGLFAGVEAQAAVDCTVSAAGVAFGTYAVSATTPTDSAGDATVTCVYLSGGATQLAYTVALSPGNSGGYAFRQLRAGSSALNYNLFVDLARTRIWGNGSAGTFVASGSFTLGPGVGNGSRVGLHTLYGRVPARQPAAPGSYSDVIVLTLTF